MVWGPVAAKEEFKESGSVSGGFQTVKFGQA